MSIVNNVLSLVNSFKEGTVVFTHGKNEFEVKTDFPVDEVWLSKTQAGNAQVCGGGSDNFDYEVTENGFVIYANVASESLAISYFVWFQKRCG